MTGRSEIQREEDGDTIEKPQENGGLLKVSWGYPLIIQHGWKIPELNGGSIRKIIDFYGPWLPACHVWLLEPLVISYSKVPEFSPSNGDFPARYLNVYQREDIS